MARLSSPRRNIFSQADFDLYPVWTWDDEHEGYLPLSEKDPIRESYEIFFIKAIFITNGYKFHGFLIGLTSYYAFGIFVAGKLFSLNLRLHALVEERLREIFTLLKCPPFEFFPIHYKSDVQFQGEKKIEGTLNLLEER